MHTYGSLKGSEILTEDNNLTSDHARSTSEVGQQSLEEMLLEYVPPPRRYCSVGFLATGYSGR